MSGGPPVARFMEHASAADANIYGGSVVPPSRTAVEPCAFLTMDLQLVKSTPSFGETIGVHSVHSRKLQEIVSANDREKVARLHREFEAERREREPNYLPPIFLSKMDEDHIIQGVGFGPEELGTLRLDRQEMFTFQAPDGQQRTFQVRLGLAKKDSTYFIAVLLVLPATPQPLFPIPSPYSRESHSRDSPYGYQPPQPGFPPIPGTSPYAPGLGFGDPRVEMTSYRTPGLMAQNVGVSANMNTFAPLQPRQDNMPGPASYQIPRSEMGQPQMQQPQRALNLQLPPIRDQRGEAQSADPMRRRDDRSGRVDIGGLLEQPDLNRRGA